MWFDGRRLFSSFFRGKVGSEGSHHQEPRVRSPGSTPPAVGGVGGSSRALVPICRVHTEPTPPAAILEWLEGRRRCCSFFSFLFCLVDGMPPLVEGRSHACGWAPVLSTETANTHVGWTLAAIFILAFRWFFFVCDRHLAAAHWSFRRHFGALLFFILSPQEFNDRVVGPSYHDDKQGRRRDVRVGFDIQIKSPTVKSGE